MRRRRLKISVVQQRRVGKTYIRHIPVRFVAALRHVPIIIGYLRYIRRSEEPMPPLTPIGRRSQIVMAAPDECTNNSEMRMVSDEQLRTLGSREAAATLIKPPPVRLRAQAPMTPAAPRLQLFFLLSGLHLQVMPDSKSARP